MGEHDERTRDTTHGVDDDLTTGPTPETRAAEPGPVGLPEDQTTGPTPETRERDARDARTG
jgi:hypothetical protein